MREPDMPIAKGSQWLYRTVHTTKKRPQVGFIFHEGKKAPVYVGIGMEGCAWCLASGYDDPNYHSCAQKTIPIEEDPEYIGPFSDGETVASVG